MGHIQNTAGTTDIDNSYTGGNAQVNASSALLYRLAVAGTALFLMLPTIIVFPLSMSDSLNLSLPPPGWTLRWYQDLFASDAYRNAFMNSLRIGIPAAILATILGTACALAMDKRTGVGARLYAGLVMAPMLFPQIVLAIGMYAVFARIGLLGSAIGVILGHAVLGIPLVFITVSAALRRNSGRLELAAETLGAGPVATFWHVTFPSIKFAVISGAIFVFAMSLDEVVLALFLTDATTITLPKQLLSELRFNLSPIVAAASSTIVIISMALLALIAFAQRKRT